MLNKQVLPLSDKATFNFLLCFGFSLLICLFVPRMMAFLPSAIGLIFFSIFCIKNKGLPKLNKTITIYYFCFLGLGMISTLWSPNPEFSLEKIIKLALVITPLFLLIYVAKNTVFLNNKPIIKIFISVFIISSVFLIFEQLNNRPITNFILGQSTAGFKLNRSYFIYSFVSLFTLYLIGISNAEKIKKNVFIIITLAISLWALYLTGSQTAQLCYIVGLIALTVLPVKNKTFGKFLFVIIGCLFIAIPFLIKPMKEILPEQVILKGVFAEASIIQRLEVWSFTVDEIKKSPIYGHGIESQRFLKSENWMKYQNADSILHAHNVALQIWIEFGVIGILFCLVFLFYCYQKIYETKNLHDRRLYLTLFVSLFVCSMTGYGFWQSWQIGAIFTFTACAILITKQTKNYKI